MLTRLFRIAALIRFYGFRIVSHRLFGPRRADPKGPGDLFNAAVGREPRAVVAGSAWASIIVPTYNPNREFLKAAIGSVQSQTDPNWELCIADDCSRDQLGLEQVLGEVSGGDPRIRFELRKTRGQIAVNSNSAAALGRAPWIVFVDQDDLLSPRALQILGDVIRGDPEADLIYSDEAKVDRDGRIIETTRKPTWSPFYFRSYMYVGHVVALKRALFEKLGGFRAGYERSQDYDLILRAQAAGAKIAHCSEVLYGWRQHAGSVAAGPGAKPWAYRAALRALRHAAPPGVRVVRGPYPGVYRSFRKEPESYRVYRWVVDGGRLRLALDAPPGTSAEPPGKLPIDLGQVCKLLEAERSSVVVLLGPTVVARRRSMIRSLVAGLWSDELVGVQGVVMERSRRVLHAGYVVQEGALKASFAGHSFYDPGYGMRLATGMDLSVVTLQAAAVRRERLLGVLRRFDAAAGLPGLEHQFGAAVRGAGGALAMSPAAQFFGEAGDFPVATELLTPESLRDEFIPAGFSQRPMVWPEVSL